MATNEVFIVTTHEGSDDDSPDLSFNVVIKTAMPTFIPDPVMQQFAALGAYVARVVRVNYREIPRALSASSPQALPYVRKLTFYNAFLRCMNISIAEPFHFKSEFMRLPPALIGTPAAPTAITAVAYVANKLFVCVKTTDPQKYIYILEVSMDGPVTVRRKLRMQDSSVDCDTTFQYLASYNNKRLFACSVTESHDFEHCVSEVIVENSLDFSFGASFKLINKTAAENVSSFYIGHRSGRLVVADCTGRVVVYTLAGQVMMRFQVPAPMTGFLRPPVVVPLEKQSAPSRSARYLLICGRSVEPRSLAAVYTLTVNNDASLIQISEHTELIKQYVAFVGLTFNEECIVLGCSESHINYRDPMVTLYDSTNLVQVSPRNAAMCEMLTDADYGDKTSRACYDEARRQCFIVCQGGLISLKTYAE